MKATSLKTAALLAGSIALLAGNATAQATSGVVGYETNDIDPGFNYLGLRLHEVEAFIGTFDSSTASSLDNSGADFSSIVGASTYFVRLTDGTLDGTLIEVPGTSFTATGIAGLSGITSDYEAGYEVRLAATINSIFGATNEAGLLEGDQNSADIVWLNNGSGGFNRFYYATPNPPFVAGGWTEIGGAGDGARTIPFTDGMIVQRRGGTSIPLVVVGDLLAGSATAPVLTGFNYLSSLYPVAATLGSSGLQGQLVVGDQNSADVVWLGDGAGGFQRFYDATPNPPFVAGGWTEIGGAGNESTALTSGMILQRRGASANITQAPPAFYITDSL